MANTTNFGWETPDDTDLVKDGALAIRTLGSAIDTSLLDLKGGTSGQVLSKNSNTDMDFVWVAQDDSNAIQNAIVDAKGDIITATAADTPARLAVGSNDQVLTADSTAATGLKWTTPSSGSLTLLSTTNIGSGSSTTVSNIDQSYTNLRVIVEGVNPTQTGSAMNISLNSNDSNFTGSVYYSNSSMSGVYWLAETYINNYGQLITGNAANVFQTDIFQYSSTSQFKPVTHISSWKGDSSTPWSSFCSGAYRNTSAITSIKIWTHYSFNAAGTIKIYGVK